MAVSPRNPSHRRGRAHRPSELSPEDDAQEGGPGVDTAAYGDEEAKTVAGEVARGVELAREREREQAHADERHAVEARRTQRIGKLTRVAAPRRSRDSRESSSRT